MTRCWIFDGSPVDTSGWDRIDWAVTGSLTTACQRVIADPVLLLLALAVFAFALCAGLALMFSKASR